MGNSSSRQQPRDRPSPWRAAFRPRPVTSSGTSVSAPSRSVAVRPVSAQHHEHDHNERSQSTRPIAGDSQDQIPEGPGTSQINALHAASSSHARDAASSTRRSRISRARMSITPSVFRRNRASTIWGEDQQENDTSSQQRGPGVPDQIHRQDNDTSSQQPGLGPLGHNRIPAPIGEPLDPPPHSDLSPESVPAENVDRLSDLASPTSSTTPNGSNRMSSMRPIGDLHRLVESMRRGRSQTSQRSRQGDDFSRLLTIAAQATAASLTGNGPERAVEELRRAAAALDPDDRTFDTFMQYLLSGRLGAHLSRNVAASNNNREHEQEGTPRPLDFFRMFQLRGMTVNPEQREPRAHARRSFLSRRPSVSRNRANSLAALEEGTGDSPISFERDIPPGTDGRVIPVLIIAIRGLSNNEGGQPRLEGEERLPSFLDALTGLGPSPTPVHTPGLDDDVLGEGLASSRHSNRLRRHHHRRASIGGLFSGRESSQRPYAVNFGTRPRSEAGPPRTTTSGTPNGPSAPPATPASAPLSAIPSGTATPNRPVSMSGLPTTTPSTNNEAVAQTQTPHSLASTAEELATPEQRTDLRRRQRRRSESDFMRYGSGSARRNGVVEPDVDRDGNRSWIIYVLGGNYPENHPILSTPSLFTESPTYEDMLLLSTLIGPAKPPVANAEDLESAGGLYKILEFGDRMAASAIDGEETLPIETAHSCGICLTGYQADETARKLKTCDHLFHRSCIDEWLTTGRNSCPLCRGLGVTEKVTEKVSDSQNVPQVPATPT